MRAFLQALSSHGVRYLVIGGIAVIYHGYARLTGDVDFFYDRSPANTEPDTDPIPVNIIGLRDLIASKRDAGRPKDLDDLQNLEG